MYKALQIARYLLLLAEDEPERERLTPMRLQKLLYYVQGWSLAVLGRPMFADRIEAWKYGPVVRRVYRRFARYGDSAIPAEEIGDSKLALSDEERSLILSVWAGYKRFSAIGLSHRSHGEKPWIDARRGLPADAQGDKEIERDTMKTFFCAQYEECREVGHPSLDEIRQSEDDIRHGRVRSFDEVKQLILR